VSAKASMATRTIRCAVPGWLECNVIPNQKMDMQRCTRVAGDLHTPGVCKLGLKAPKSELWCPRKPQKRLTYASIAHMIGLLDTQRQAALSKFRNIFVAGKIPTVSPSDYALFLFESFHCSSSTALCTFIYLERAAGTKHDVQMTPYTVHRLLLSAFVVACKYVEDGYFSMQAFAQVGGVSLEDLLLLEISFVKLTGCRLYVPQETFDTCKLLALTLR